MWHRGELPSAVGQPERSPQGVHLVADRAVRSALSFPEGDVGVHSVGCDIERHHATEEAA